MWMYGNGYLRSSLNLQTQTMEISYFEILPLQRKSLSKNHNAIKAVVCIMRHFERLPVSAMILYDALSQSTSIIKFKSIEFYGRQFNPENPDV